MSNVFKRPSWQDKAVAGYIKALKGKHKGYYNTTGRAQPDVSLLGDDYLTLTGGQASIHDGTSASAPVFAAMVALINDMRLREKKPVLGFLNPILYSAKANSAFRDVKDGSNSVGCADGNFFETGWEALAGWDAATGLGEPNFAELATILKV
jgi:tripeptidyl-peptidase-1